MKLTVFLLLVGILQVQARGYGQTLTLKIDKSPLEKVLQEITRQTGYEFFYRAEQMKQANVVTIQVKNEPLKEVLDSIFNKQPFTYALANRTIVIAPRIPPPQDKQLVPDPPINVHGRVLGKNGITFPGIFVNVKGTPLITLTDEKGEFSLFRVNPKAILSFSGISIEPYSVELNGRTELTIIVTSKVLALGEVVVNKGYYTETEKTSTGNVTTIKSADIQKTSTANPLLALQGRVPGLNITASSGLPGATNLVELRGRNSINAGTSPLYIVDGVPFDPTSQTSFKYTDFSPFAIGPDPLSTLNPSNIEEISVLKDADATAIYGSRGANGVILITTKKGKAGKTTFDADISSSSSRYPHFVKMLDLQQYLAMRREAFKNDTMTPQLGDYDVNGTWDSTRSTDWQRALLGGSAHITNFQGRLSGGNETTRFSINAGYRKQTLPYPGSGDKGDGQGQFGVNINHNSEDKRLNIDFSATYVYDNNNLPSGDLAGSIYLAPDAPALYKADGSLNWENSTFANPLAKLKRTKQYTTRNLNSSFTLQYTLLPDLYVRARAGYGDVLLNEQDLQPAASFDPAALAAGFVQRQSSEGNGESKSWITEPQLSYNHQFGKSKLEALLGSTFQESISRSEGFTAVGFSSDAQLQNFNTAITKNFYPQNYSDYRYAAAYGRFNYNWDGKYILNLTGRRDGSSRFGAGRQFGNFWSAAGAWVFTRESWFKDMPWLGFGKIRASYGITGNDQIGDYLFLSTYAYSDYGTYGGNTALVPSTPSNPRLQWESTRKAEIGLDLGFFNDRVNIGGSFYRARSNNQLSQYDLPDITGYTDVTANLPADVQNTGVEITLNSTNIRSKGFTWKTSFNFSLNRNKLLSYPDLAHSPYKVILALGQPVDVKKLYQYTGVDPQTGVMSYVDVNKDGVIDYQDAVVTKSVSPRFFGGMGNNFSWKGFQLDLFFSFIQQKGKSYLSAFSMPGSMSNQLVDVLARWRKPGDVTAIQKFSQAGYGATGVAYSDFEIAGENSYVNTSFIRLKTASLNYSLPAAWVKKAGLKSLSFYLQANNLLTFTAYKGADPETAGTVLPQLRNLSVGAHIEL